MNNLNHIGLVRWFSPTKKTMILTVETIGSNQKLTEFQARLDFCIQTMYDIDNLRMDVDGCHISRQYSQLFAYLIGHFLATFMGNFETLDIEIIHIGGQLTIPTQNAAFIGHIYSLCSTMFGINVDRAEHHGVIHATLDNHS